MKSAADIGVQMNRLYRAANGNPTRQARIARTGGQMYSNITRLNAQQNRSVYEKRSRAVRQGRSTLFMSAG